MKTQEARQAHTKPTSGSDRHSLDHTTPDVAIADVITAEDLGMVPNYSDNEDCQDCD